ncbi:hypothetical protein [Mucilaginibacter arboris]|uniref:Uncharacterized protein n=1 Tax=Mucilaginibacter arboris TaxID=2682090 RepID=A0A7K1SZY6_9SPHI|nr:hypothetical protein [Mucilaginibacter arboris]MVN22876.1 hypothetical protein [Mucilaginibacter arboris]
MKLPKPDIPDIIKKVWRYGEITLIIISALVLVGWTISPVKNWLVRNGIFDQSTIYDIVALTTVLLISIISELKNAIKELSKKLDKFNRESNSQIIENGILQVYPNLNSILASIDNKREKTLDVIGLTLYSAWPQIQAWLFSVHPHDWKIRLYILDSDYIKENSMTIPSKWIKEAESAKDQIEYFIEEKKDLLANIATELTLKPYSNLPAIHGFKIGDGSLYISFSHWSEKNLVDDPHYFYEYFHCEDKTTRAKAYRNLFDNWTTYYTN